MKRRFSRSLRWQLLLGLAALGCQSTRESRPTPSGGALGGGASAGGRPAIGEAGRGAGAAPSAVGGWPGEGSGGAGAAGATMGGTTGGGGPVTPNVPSTPRTKPRVLVTTDGEIDDKSSMVRFLTYASDYDVAGIVQVNSNAQRNGHSAEKWIEAQIAAYDQHLPNLRKHRPDFPSAAQLLSVLKVGNENADDYGKDPATIADSEGTQHIIQVLLDDDPRPVHILAWGGANTQANAFAQLKAKYTAREYDRAVEKAVLYCIWFQDKGGSYLVSEHPRVKLYGSGVDDTNVKNDSSWRDVWDYRSVDGKKGGERNSANPKAIQTFMDDPWMLANIKTGHGALGALYPQSYTSEGDTPSFLTLVDNGLEQHVDYTRGGWGGRPVYVRGNFMQDGADDNAGKPDMHYTFWRWIAAAQNDWAARSDWFVAIDYKDANHPPEVRVAGDHVRSVAGGSTVELDATPTTDPDGDELTFKWWQYYEADSASGKVTIASPGAPAQARFTAPAEPGKEVHVVLEVTDRGTPPLTRYQRIVVQVR